MSSKTVKSLNLISDYLKNENNVITQIRVYVSKKDPVIILMEVCNCEDLNPNLVELVYDGIDKVKLTLLDSNGNINKNNYTDTIIENNDIGHFFKTIRTMVRILTTYMRYTNLSDTTIVIEKDSEDSFSDTFSLYFSDYYGKEYNPMTTSVNYFNRSIFENNLLNHKLFDYYHHSTL